MFDTVSLSLLLFSFNNFTASLQLIPALIKNKGNLCLELHSHCTTGLAPLVYLDAIKLGIDTVFTAVPPLANGSSQPSVLNISTNLRYLGYAPAINDGVLGRVSQHLNNIAKREGLPIGQPLEYDGYQYIHQVPGGVISNLKHQLGKLRMENRLDDVLAETVRVREDLGYPIMVTPFSQYVVSQASMNVMLGERYKQVLDNVIEIALGHFGKESSDAIEPDIKDLVLSIPRAKELAAQQAVEPSLKEVREKMGATTVSDEEFLLRYIVRENSEIEAMRASGPIKEYSTDGHPLALLLREMLKQNTFGQISIKKQDMSIFLAR